MSSFTVNGVLYTTTSGTTVTIANNSGTYSGPSNLVIPKSVNNGISDYDVVSSVTSALANNSTITSAVFLSTELNTLGTTLFSNCNNLISADFSSCPLLTISGSNAFSNCSNFTTHIGPPNLRTASSSCFQSSGLISFSPSSTLTTISTSCFNNCSNLTSVNITHCNSLLTIGSQAFSSCTNLASIILPRAVTTITSFAFSNCTKLLSVTFLGTTIPALQTNCFPTNLAATAYYQPGTTNLTTLTNSGFFGFYQEIPPYPCFKENSKILTDKGYIKVEDLKKGDLVQTLNDGFKPIYMIGKKEIYHTATNNRIKDQLYKCTSSEYPEIIEPLILTGCHCILVEEFINDKQRDKTIDINGDIYITDNLYRLPVCADERASVYDIPGNNNIYHFALENDDYYMNYGIYANGLLVETCSKRYLCELSGMSII
jgi:hypothetical protein